MRLPLAAAQSSAPVSPEDVAPPAERTGGFDGAKAFDQVAKLVSFGPHPPATPAIHAVQEYLSGQLKSFRLRR